MSPTGWLTMIVSIGGVLAAAAWAYYKVLSTPKETEYLGSPTRHCRKMRRNKAQSGEPLHSGLNKSPKIILPHPERAHVVPIPETGRMADRQHGPVFSGDMPTNRARIIRAAQVHRISKRFFSLSV